MIRILDDVLTHKECNSLIDIAKNSLGNTGVLGNQIDGYRVAMGTWLDIDNPVIHKIKELVKIGSDLPIENQEKVHIVKYPTGGEYKAHHDFFHENEEYYERCVGKAGQRTHSFLFYLNDRFNGGETEFPSKGIKVSAKIGRLLIWENLDYNNKPDIDTLHAGLPVIDGEKWIAIVWVRENKFQ